MEIEVELSCKVIKEKKGCVSMDRNSIVSFNKAFAVEATDKEKQIVNEMLTVWGKFDPAVAKSPAMFRKGILFGLVLEKAVASGEIVLSDVRASRKKNKASDKEAF